MAEAKTNGQTELVFILDRSGSMAGLESDTIGGFNGMLTQHRSEGGDVLVSTVLFTADTWKGCVQVSLVLKEVQMSPCPLRGVVGGHGFHASFFRAVKFPAACKSYVNMEFRHGRLLL